LSPKKNQNDMAKRIADIPGFRHTRPQEDWVMNKRYYLERVSADVDAENRGRLAVPDLPCVIGRDPSCELQLDENRISRQHARFSAAPDGLLIEDLDSTNGSFVDCRRIETPTLLKPGQRLHLADHELALVVDRPGGATLVQARSGPAPGDTIIGYTGDPAGFPLLAPAFYEVLNQGLIEVSWQPIVTTRGAAFGERLVPRSRHRTLNADTATLFEIGVALGEESRLGAMLRQQTIETAARAGLGPRLVIDVHTAEQDQGTTVWADIQRLADAHPQLEISAVLQGPTASILGWIEALGTMPSPNFNLGLNASQPDLVDALPLPLRAGLLLAEPGDLAADSKSRVLIDRLRSRWTRVMATGLDQPGQIKLAHAAGADLLCGMAVTAG